MLLRKGAHCTQSRTGARRLGWLLLLLVLALPRPAAALPGDEDRGELYRGFLGHMLSLAPAAGVRTADGALAISGELLWAPTLRTFRPVFAPAALSVLATPERGGTVQGLLTLLVVGGGAGVDADGAAFTIHAAIPPPLLTVLSFEGTTGLAFAPRLRRTFHGDGSTETVAELGLALWVDLGSIAAEPP